LFGQIMVRHMCATGETRARLPSLAGATLGYDEAALSG
jgi:hypothetical protein